MSYNYTGFGPPPLGWGGAYPNQHPNPNPYQQQQQPSGPPPNQYQQQQPMPSNIGTTFGPPPTQHQPFAAYPQNQPAPYPAYGQPQQQPYPVYGQQQPAYPAYPPVQQQPYPANGQYNQPLYPPYAAPQQVTHLAYQQHPQVNELQAVEVARLRGENERLRDELMATLASEETRIMLGKIETLEEIERRLAARQLARSAQHQPVPPAEQPHAK